MQTPEKVAGIVAFCVAALISSACSSESADDAERNTAPSVERPGAAPRGPTGCPIETSARRCFLGAAVERSAELREAL